MIRDPLQVADDIQEYHACGSLALSRGKTLNVFLAKLFFLAVDIILVLADLAHCSMLPFCLASMAYWRILTHCR